MAGGNRDRENFGLVGCHARHRKADGFPPHSQTMYQRVALGQHALEFALAPAAVKRRAMKLRECWRVTQEISGASCASTLNGGGACAGQRSARILAALPTRCGAPKRDAPTASSIGATRGRISELPLPLTTWKYTWSCRASIAEMTGGSPLSLTTGAA